jgi:hypothetical protein
VQPDTVALRDDGVIELGECKWGPVRSPAALRAELATKLPAFPNRRAAAVRLRYFTRDRVAPPAPALNSPAESWHPLSGLHGRR